MVDKTRNPAERHLEANGGLVLTLLVGLFAAVLGAVLWAVIAGVTGSKISFAAVGIGLLVGLSMSMTARTSRGLPMAAAFLSLLGCLIGALLVDIQASAELSGLDPVDLANLMTTRPELVREVVTAGFDLIDPLFWLLAAICGYQLMVWAVKRLNALASTRQVARPAARPSGYEFNTPQEIAPVIVSHPSEFFALPGAAPAAPDSQARPRLPAQSGPPSAVTAAKRPSKRNETRTPRGF